MITTIDLNHSLNPYPLLSQNLIDSIKKTLDEGKKVMLYINKRGDSNAYVCKDCSYKFNCRNCDISLTLHKFPNPFLICHECRDTQEVPAKCPNCSSLRLFGVGGGTQKFEESLKKLFSSARIARLDSDKLKKEGLTFGKIKDANIIISTQIINSLAIDDLGLVAIPLFEQDLMIPEFDSEEKLYTNIMLNIKRGAPLLIQTFIPKNPLLKIIEEGNYNEYLKYISLERQQFSYPPFVDMVIIKILSKSSQKAEVLALNITNRLNSLNEKNELIINSLDAIKKTKIGYQKKITLRGKDLMNYLEEIRFEISKNREISLEWKS